MMKCVFIGLCLVLTLFSGCDETPPFIDFTEPVKSNDSTYIVTPVPARQHKAVLLEDITGVRCNNCPSAAKKAHDIVLAKTEDSVVLMALYTEDIPSLTFPWEGGFPVLNSKIATQIVGALGLPGSLPSGYVDRHIFAPQTVRYNNNYGTWGDLVNQRIKLGTPVNIRLQDSVLGRKLIVKIRLQYTETVSTVHKFCLYLTESGIVSKQTIIGGTKDDYVHNHAVRYSFGSDLGKQLTETLVPGRTFIREFEYEIPAEYNIANCSLICVVADNVTEEVLNVRQIELQ